MHESALGNRFYFLVEKFQYSCIRMLSSTNCISAWSELGLHFFVHNRSAFSWAAWALLTMKSQQQRANNPNFYSLFRHSSQSQGTVCSQRHAATSCPNWHKPRVTPLHKLWSQLTLRIQLSPAGLSATELRCHTGTYGYLQWISLARTS